MKSARRIKIPSKGERYECQGNDGRWRCPSPSLIFFLTLDLFDIDAYCWDCYYHSSFHCQEISYVCRLECISTEKCFLGGYLTFWHFEHLTYASIFGMAYQPCIHLINERELRRVAARPAISNLHLGLPWLHSIRTCLYSTPERLH